MARVRKVVIPVAGLGTRSLPYSKVAPKEMLPVIDTPTIHFIVEEAVSAGIEQVIFVTAQGKSALEDYFDTSEALEERLRAKGKDALADKLQRLGSLVNVLSVRQKQQLGLGHAVLCAEPLVGKEPFAVCLGDEIFPTWGSPVPEDQRALRRLVAASERSGHSAVGVMEVPTADTKKYGIVDVGGAVLDENVASVRSTVEKPEPSAAPSHYAMVGRYVFQAEVFGELKNTQPGVGGEIQLTDAMDRLAAAGALEALLLKDKRYDIGNPLQYVLAQVDSALERPELAGSLRELLQSRV
jgi:UTP--glucose-1-phosphate uridylyltransferase